MINLKSVFAIAPIVAGLGLAPVAAKEVTLRMRTAALQKTIWQTQIDQLAVGVAEETEGRVKIKIFYGSQLGTERSFLTQVMRGRIDMVAFVDHCNDYRNHESLANLTPTDVYYGRGAKILKMREEIKKQTIRNRKLHHQAAAV